MAERRLRLPIFGDFRYDGAIFRSVVRKDMGLDMRNPQALAEQKNNKNTAPLDPLEEAIDRGRAGRGKNGPSEWNRLRARVLQQIIRGLTRARIGGELGISSQRVTQLTEEACDAVLRSEPSSIGAEQACAPTWERWCESRGDELACVRLRNTHLVVEQPPAKPRRRSAS